MRGSNRLIRKFRLAGVGAWLGLLAFAAPALAQEPLVIALRTPIINLDPILETSSTMGFAMINVLETLVTTNPAGEYEPMLATSWENVNETTWRFHLREGVTFHDGTPFDAEAVVFNLDRMASEESLHASNFSWYDGADVVDDLTVDIHTKGPYPGILSALNFYIPYIVSPTAVETLGDDINTAVVGTGPYRVVSHTPSDVTVLEAFADYWGGAPSVQRAEFLFVPEDNTRLAAYLAGEVDILSFVESSQIPVLAARDDTVIIEGPSDLADMLWFNTQKPPLDNVQVRQALAYGMDLDLILETVLEGTGERYGLVFAPGIVGFDPETMSEPHYTHDPERARELLAEAGYADGLDVEFLIADRPEHARIAEAVQAQLAEIGVNVSIRSLDWGTFLTATANGEHQMMVVGTYAFGDADRILPEFETAAIGSRNRSMYSNAEVDALIAQQRNEMDPQARQAIIEEIVARLTEDVPRLMVRARTQVQAVRSNIEGYVHHPAKLDLRGVVVN
ncbi:MAG TPA: ABC transporter substrate-binding protein [Trueperaceae bacterium]